MSSSKHLFKNKIYTPSFYFFDLFARDKKQVLTITLHLTSQERSHPFSPLDLDRMNKFCPSPTNKRERRHVGPISPEPSSHSRFVPEPHMVAAAATPWIDSRRPPPIATATLWTKAVPSSQAALHRCGLAPSSRATRRVLFFGDAWLGGVRLVQVQVPRTPLLRAVEAVAVVLLARASFLPPMPLFQCGL
jgi:hypothetical protein